VRRITILLFLSVFCFTTVMQAQAPAPKPDPEMKKLHVFVGHWTYEGEAKPGPLGPGGKFAGEYDGQMILGGFFLQCRTTEKGPMGERQGLLVIGYDPVNKNYPRSVFRGDGRIISGASTIDGNSWTYAGKFSVGGKQYLSRATTTFAADMMSAARKGEISADGNTWTPSYEDKFTKSQPAPKK
jgi:hypothetical protein